MAEQKVLTLREVEKRIIRQTLADLKGDMLATAEALGIGKTTLSGRLKEYALEDEVSHG